MLRAIRRTFDFSGTASRRDFWWYFLAYAVAVLIGSVLAVTSDPLIKSVVVSFVGLFALPLAALTVRRLHDTGRSGWWAMLYAVPIVGFLALLALCAARSDPGERPWPTRNVHVLGRLAVILFAVLCLSRLFWAPYWIPSGAMKPALLPGDYLVARLRPGLPERGDIVVFREGPVLEFVFRVVALEGDEVEMRDGVLHLNGAAVGMMQDGTFEEPRTPGGPARSLPICKENAPRDRCLKDRYIETLPGGRSYPVLDTFTGRSDNMRPVTVPPRHVFVLGDNRDNANDSRFGREISGRGMVPIEDINARANRVLFSSREGLANIAAWRGGRFLTEID